MKNMTFYHSKPEFVIRGFEFGLSVVVATNDSVEVFALISAGDNSKRVSLDRSANGEGFSIFKTDIAASFFEGAGEISYCFLSGNEKSDEYSVPVCSIGRMPPLAVTEFYARPKGLNVTLFFEVMNPSRAPVDLYNYKIMAYSGDGCAAENYICSLELSCEAGKNIIAPGEVAVLWPLMPKNHKLDPDGKYTKVDGFIEAAMADFPKPAFDLVAERDNIRIIPIEACEFDEQKGEFVAKNNINKLPIKTELTTLIIVPRDTSPEDGSASMVYRMVYNRSDDGNRDTPVKYSSVWYFDVRNPSEGVAVCHKAVMTPGKLGRGQTIPDCSSRYPVIIPLTADTKISNASGKLSIDFVTAPGNIVDAYILLKGDDGKYHRLNADADDDGVCHVELEHKKIFRLKTLEYVICVHDGVRLTTLGTTSSPLSVKIEDAQGPFITDIFPTEKYGFDTTKSPEIRVGFFDISRVNLSQSILCLDKKNVSAEAQWNADSVTFTPAKPLRYGDHYFEIMLVDSLGNKTYRKVNFRICRHDELNLYRGEVHSHTADSDGTAGPREALTYARDVGKVDFFSVTEHSHYTTEDVYERQIDIADEFDDPGRFAALFGFEMTWNNSCALWGHMNILNSRWFDTDIKGHGIPEIYDRLSKDKGAVAMFNHPGLPWGNFHDFDNYSPEADRAVCLAEIKGAGYDREYMDMLAAGWHTSPAFNEDNHSYNWTTALPSTTYALAPSLTRENILDAFRRRRTYSTTDPTMKIRFRINGEWMGARLSDPLRLSVEADITTESESGIGNIALVTEDNIVVASVNAGTLQAYKWDFNIAPDFDYYYLKITSPGKYTVTAPIWVEGRDQISIKSLKLSHSDSDYKPNMITAEIKNNSSTEIRGLHIDFYLTPGGFDLERTVPYKSVVLPSLPAGAVANVSYGFPDIAGVRRVSAVVRGRCGLQHVADTSMVLLSPIKVVEILPKTSPAVDREGKEFKNPFPYFRMCNLSNRDINLDGYFTRLWTTTGKAPSEDRILRLDGHTIKAGDILTVWIRPKGSAFDTDDFNRHYGVMMGDDELMVTDIHAISSQKETCRLELLFEKETLSRNEYNFKQIPGSDLNVDRAIIYSAEPNMTGTSKMLSNSADPTPAAKLTIK